MSESWREQLEKPTINLVLFFVFLATSVIAPFIAMFLVALFFGCFIPNSSGSLGAAVLLIVMLLTFVAFAAMAVLNLVKFIQKKNHNKEVMEAYKDVIEAEEHEENLRKEEKMMQELAEKQERAATANASLNTLKDSEQLNNAMPASQHSSKIAEGTQGTMLYEIDGKVTSVLQVYEDRCVLIAKTTARSYVAGKFFNGTKEFFYEDLTNIQFREATKTFNGYLQFEYPGAVNISTSTFGGTGGNYGSENSFVFAPNCVPDEMIYANESKLEASNRVVGSIYQYMHKRIREEKSAKKSGSAGSVQFISVADELEKYRNLLENGTITQEEFDAKKKQLLGL